MRLVLKKAIFKSNVSFLCSVFGMLFLAFNVVLPSFSQAYVSGKISEAQNPPSFSVTNIQSDGVGMLSDFFNPPGQMLSGEADEEVEQFSLKPQLGELSRGAVSLPNSPSLLFFPRQMSLIKDFERGVLFPEPKERSVVEVQEIPETDLRPPEPRQIVREPAPEPEKFVPPTEPSIRELYLSGIAYNGPEKWTIWLNGSRVTPSNIPEEIFRINVENEFVEIIWHDKQTHNVYPIRLRPNQRFNLDARMFLPG